MTRSSRRIRLEPKIREYGKRSPFNPRKDEIDEDIKTIDVEGIVKKNAIRLAITIIIFTTVFAIRSLPFSTAQKVSQGIKWAITYKMNWRNDFVDRRNIIPTISNQLDRFIGTKDLVGDSNRNKTYISPVTGRISSPFEDSIHPIFNTRIEARGIEISGQSKREIKAIAHGKVLQVQESIYGGKRIILGHEDSMRSVYEGCFDSSLLANQEVEQGTILGRTKEVEDGEQSILYFELWKGDQAVNPLDYIIFEEESAG